MKKTTKKISSKIADDEYVKSKNKKKHKFDVGDLALTISIVLSVGAVSSTIISKKVAMKNFEGVNTELFQKTTFDVPVVLPIKNGVVNLNIIDCFTDTQLQEIKAGIEKLDFDAKGIEFNVSYTDEDVEKSINIKSYDFIDPSEKELSFGYADIYKNNFTAKLCYPLTVYLNTEKIEYYGVNLNNVVRHELMHCLGFTDLRDHSKYKDYLMLHTDLGYFKELTQDEYDALNKIYSPEKTGLVTVEKPTEIRYHYNEDVDTKKLIAEEELVY